METRNALLAGCMVVHALVSTNDHTVVDLQVYPRETQTLELKVRDLLQPTRMFSILSVTALSELRAEPVQTA